MKPVVAIVAAGNMGAGIGRRLVENGLTVLTLLNGRSAATQQRAASAGLQPASLDAVMEADLLLSIVPPRTRWRLPSRPRSRSNPRGASPSSRTAMPSAPRPCDTFTRSSPPPARSSSMRESSVFRRNRAARVRASMRPGSGRKARCALEPCLDMRLLDGPVGAASALKMAYAGISKGNIAIMAAMILAAERSGSAEALRQELSESEQALLKTMSTRIPRSMFPKAWRWVAEMQEIAEFAKEDPAAHEIWMGISKLYDRLAEDLGGSRKEADALLRFFDGAKPDG